jgi:hypothetical protein
MEVELTEKDNFTRQNMDRGVVQQSGDLPPFAEEYPIKTY